MPEAIRRSCHFVAPPAERSSRVVRVNRPSCRISLPFARLYAVALAGFLDSYTDLFPYFTEIVMVGCVFGDGAGAASFDFSAMRAPSCAGCVRCPLFSSCHEPCADVAATCDLSEYVPAQRSVFRCLSPGQANYVAAHVTSCLLPGFFPGCSTGRRGAEDHVSLCSMLKYFSISVWIYIYVLLIFSPNVPLFVDVSLLWARRTALAGTMAVLMLYLRRAWGD